ncbi:MAG: ATP-binding protein [Planctomycetes bacterium]|nr:ATP-binding protein [Planctomycetota bacterium]
MITREIGESILRALKKYPVVSLTGPRQSGKTFLLTHLLKDYQYVLLEDPDTRRFAKEDPRGFLSQYQSGAILDEVQRAPELFSYLQGIVDKRRIPGQFVLSGSQNFLLLENISQSLAGRVAVLNLLPFSLAEILERPGLPIPQDRLADPTGITVLSKEDLFTTLHRGMFPPILDRGLDPQDWLKNYYQTFLERDVRLLSQVGDLDTFSRFVQLCAGRSGQILDLVSLGNDCGISHTTVRRWISILQASFHVIQLQPYFENFNKRLIKRPKIYFLDTGLLCYLLGIRSPQDLLYHSARGAIFESFVISEFYKKFCHAGQIPRLYFWRDASGHEVDLVIPASKLLFSFEIKSGQTVVADFFEGLKFFEKISRQPPSGSAVIHGGDGSRIENQRLVYSWRLL